MWFHIRAIKEVYGKEYTINTLMQFASGVVLQQFLDSYHIIAISKSNYSDPVESFGDIYGIIRFANNNHDFVLQADSVSDALHTLLFLGLDIYAINSYTHPLDAPVAVNMIQQMTKEVRDTQQASHNSLQQQTSHIQQAYIDPKLSQIQQSVTRVLQDADYALKQYTQAADHSQLLSNCIEDLKKMRLSKNTEKLQEIIHKIYRHIDAMEHAFLQTLPHENIDAQSIISLASFVRSYDTWIRSQKLYTLGASLGIKEKLYAKWGKLLLILRFLGIDMYRSVASWRDDTKQIVDTGLLLVLSITVIVNILGLIVSIGEGLLLNHLLGRGLLWIGLWGVAFGIGSLIRHHRGWNTARILLISILIFVCLRYSSKRILILT